MLLLGVVVSACEPTAPRPVAPPTTSPAAVAPIVLGAILDVSTDAGPDGRQRYEAAALAVELVNRRGGLRLPSGESRPLKLAVFDDGDSPDRVEPGVRRLADDGALAVIGPSDPELTLPARRAAEAASLPMIALADASRADAASWRWTFALTVPDDEALAAALDYLGRSGVERIGWLAPRTIETLTLRQTLVRLTGSRQLQVAAEELYAPGDPNQGPRLSRLQAAGPRAILAWPRDAHEAVDVARAAATVTALAPLFLGPAAADPTTLALAGGAAAGVRAVTVRLAVADDLWDHDPLTPVVRDFRRELQARTGRPPTTESAAAWDAVRLVVTTAERTGASRSALRDGLEGTTEYLAASGTVTFGPGRHDGLDRRAFVVARADGRRWRLPP
jgi:branched-chain amino acid transport system substrate-binding protein